MVFFGDNALEQKGLRFVFGVVKNDEKNATQESLYTGKFV